MGVESTQEVIAVRGSERGWVTGTKDGKRGWRAVEKPVDEF